MSSQGGVRFAVPVGIEHGGSVTSKQRDLVGKLAPLVQGNDGECAAARGVPIDRQVLGVDLRKWPRQQKPLDQICSKTHFLHNKFCFKHTLSVKHTRATLTTMH